MRQVALLLLVFGLLAGCEDNTPTTPWPAKTPTPGPCEFTVGCDPVAGFPGVYRCVVTPAGPTTFSVNGTNVGDPQGILIASSGDIVSACRNGCNCTPALVLR